jgi:hypothetical protein
MGRKKKVTPDDPEQYARFVKLAEEMQTDDAEERFEEAMKRVVAFKPKRKKPSEPANQDQQ